MASTAPAHDAVLDEILAVAPREPRARARRRRRARALRLAALPPRRCSSPTTRPSSRRGSRSACGARLLERGVAIHEHSRVRALRATARASVVAETARRRACAPAPRCWPSTPPRAACGRCASRLSVTSSHIVLTEPVPDVLEAIGWTGGECITDARTFVHYFRTTRDGRIAFGWGGGRLAPGARLDGRVEVDADVAARDPPRTWSTMFPALAGRAITHAWGGPIDVSPSHLPQIGTLDGAPVHYAFGFTGNGVGPSHLAGRVLAGAGARRDDDRPARARRPDARPRAAGAVRLGGRDARAPCLFA